MYGITLKPLQIFLGIFMFLCLLVCLSEGRNIKICAETIEDKNVEIRFEKTLANIAYNLLNIYPNVKNDLEKTIEWKIDFCPSIILIKDSSTFYRIAGNSNIVAFAQPSHNLIVIDASKIAVKPFSQEIILKHELCHLLLHRYIALNTMPKWFEEGVCQWVTGGVGEILQDKSPSLNNAVISGTLIKFDDLKERFPENKPSLDLAYEESRSIIEFIGSTYGTGKIIEILNYLNYGESFEYAFEKAISMTVGEFENKWHDSFSPHLYWLLFFAQNIYEIIFFGMASITILAFIKYIIKRRKDAQYQRK